MHRTVLLTLAITLLTVLPASAQGTSASEQALFERLVVAEAGGEGVLGQALVARSVLNRVALLRSNTLNTGTYLARGRSLSGVINGRMQYEPVSSGTINRRRSAAQLRQAREAIALARDTDALRAALRRAGKSEAQINNLLRATGFRTRSAYNDSSQNYDRTTFGNHVFNTDRFSRRQDTNGLFERYYALDRASSRRELSATYAEPEAAESAEPEAADTTGLAGAVRATTASGREEEAASAESAGSATATGVASGAAAAGRDAGAAAARSAGAAAGRTAGAAAGRAAGAAAGRSVGAAAGRALAEAAESNTSAAAATPAPAPTPETPTESWQRGLQEAEDAWLNGARREEIPVAETVAPLGPGPYEAEASAAAKPAEAVSPAASADSTAASSGSINPLAAAAGELVGTLARRALNSGSESGSAPSSAPAASSSTKDASASAQPASESDEANEGSMEAGPSDADRQAFAAFTRRFGRLRLGARGPMVTRLQSKILAEKTGFFGIATQQKLQAWQRAEGLAPSGEVDLETFLALRNVRNGRKITPRVNQSRTAQRLAAVKAAAESTK